MTCDALQNHLLALDDPARPVGAEVRVHLAACSACREWHRQLLLLERAVAQLPVPPADAARAALLDQLLHPDRAVSAASPPEARPEKPRPVAPRPSIALRLGSLVLDEHASPRRRAGAGIVVGVAASLLLFVAGWLIWSGQQGRGPSLASATSRRFLDPLVVDLQSRRLTSADRLAEANSVHERVAALADVAQEMRRLNAQLARTASADDLQQWAELYTRVVKDALVVRAGELPAAERQAVLEPIVRDLQEAGSEALRLQQDHDIPPAAHPALQRISLVASEGWTALQTLYQSGRS